MHEGQGDKEDKGDTGDTEDTEGNKIPLSRCLVFDLFIFLGVGVPLTGLTQLKKVKNSRIADMSKGFYPIPSV